MKYFEDYVVGDHDQGGSHKVTKDEIVAFASEYDPQPFHIDEDAANASVFGGLTASGFHTVAIQGRLIHTLPDKGAVIAGLGWDEVRFVNPVHVGDTLTLQLACIEKRPSSSKPERGVVRNSITLRNQRGEDVLTSIHSVLVKRRDTAK
jgi:acyl dehydratase